MSNKTFLSILAVTILSACAVSPDIQRNALAAATSCCRAIGEIPITDVLGAKESIDITLESPVFDFSTGRSHFASFALPDPSSGKRLELRAVIGTPTIVDGLGGHTSFFPAVTFLDEKHEPLGTAYDEKPTAQLNGGWSRGSFLSYANIPENARYAVLHTVPRKFGELYTGYVDAPGMTMMAGSVPIKMGAGRGPMRTVFVSTGTVMVSLQ